MKRLTFRAEPYAGRKIGNSYMCRVGWQVVCRDADTGKRVYYWGNTPCLKSCWVARHYRTGVNKKDADLMLKYMEWAEDMAAKLNDPLCVAAAEVNDWQMNGCKKNGGHYDRN